MRRHGLICKGPTPLQLTHGFVYGERASTDGGLEVHPPAVCRHTSIRERLYWGSRPPEQRTLHRGYIIP